MCVCPTHRGVHLNGAWGCLCVHLSQGWGVPVCVTSGCVGMPGLSFRGVCLAGGCQGMSVLGVALSWARSSCPSSRRALYVVAGCGGAPSWARRRWRGEPDPQRLLHWQHRAPVASGAKYH